MASQVSPGITIKERDLSNAVVIGAQQINAAFASSFKKGPIGKVTSVSSQKELVNIFGKPSDANAEDWFVASEFLGYGGRLSVVRAATNVLNATSGTAGVLVRNETDWAAGAGTSEVYVAKTSGSWGNSLKVVLVDRGADQYVTFSSVPSGMAAGTDVAFSGGKLGEVLSWDTTTKTAAVILNDPTVRLTTSDTLASPELGVVATTSNLSGGTLYTAATGVATTGGSGTGLTVNTTVTVGSVLTFAAGSGGTLYVTANNVTTTGGTGTGLTVNIVAAAGSITGIVIANAGTGYTVGDTITIAGGGSNATFVVSTVKGAVSAVAVAAGGVGYLVNDTITISGTTGTSATFKVATVTDTNISITAVSDWYSNTNIPGTDLKLTAIGIRPGTSQYASDTGVSYDELHVVVIDIDGQVSGAKNTILERLTHLSKLTDGKSSEGAATYYKDVINSNSAYIFAGATVSGFTNPSSLGAGQTWDQTASASAVSGGKLNLSGLKVSDLKFGIDDYAYTNAEIGDAYDLFLDTETIKIDFILMGGSMTLETNSKSKASKVISIAASRKDCVAFVSAHKGNQIGTNGALTATQQRENTINFFNGLTSTSYAVFDSGYKYFYDRFNDKYRYLPCNGDIAGLCVSTSAALDDWYSPAGLNRGSLRNAVKLAYNPSKADRDELYQARINPIVSFPGSGVTLFGDKTALASPSAFDRINVRRLFLNLENRIESLAKQVLFEQNDEITRGSFTGAVNSYLNEVSARRGITDFLVVCDETNNTPDVIDRNEFVAEIFVKPTRSINYITLTFTATKSGVSFNEVVGR